MLDLENLTFLQVEVSYGIKLDTKIPKDEFGNPMNELLYMDSEPVGFLCESECDFNGSAIVISDSVNDILSADDEKEEIAELDLTIQPEWNNQLKEFCDKHNLEYKTPKWLCSWDTDYE